MIIFSYFHNQKMSDMKGVVKSYGTALSLPTEGPRI